MAKRREFSVPVKRDALDRAMRRGGTCEVTACETILDLTKRNYHFDHIKPDALGGKPELSNCQVICDECHGEKTGKQDVPRIAKADAQWKSQFDEKKPSRWRTRNDLKGEPKRGRIELPNELPLSPLMQAGMEQPE